MTATAASTIRDIVEGDYRAAAVLHRYHIEFCCGGEGSLAEACRQRGVDPGIVLEEVTAACGAPDSGAPRFAAWDAETLVAYIVGNHHQYVREAIPMLLARTARIAAAHGERYPELTRVACLFSQAAGELNAHLDKEENILFPYIVSVSASVRRGVAPPRSPFGTIGNPIRVMEMEHESAQATIAEIRRLTRGYTPPENACAAHAVFLREPEAFDHDLLAHVDLENHLLFPKALRLEAGV